MTEEKRNYYKTSKDPVGEFVSDLMKGMNKVQSKLDVIEDNWNKMDKQFCSKEFVEKTNKFYSERRNKLNASV